MRRKKIRKETINSSDANSEARYGRIVTHYGRELEVEILDGPLAGSIQRCHQRASIKNKSLVTGDLVLCKPDSKERGVVVSQCARKNVFGRYDAKGKFKPLASNLDRVLVVFAVFHTCSN